MAQLKKTGLMTALVLCMTVLNLMASVCVDEYGNDIECPDFSAGVAISDEYKIVTPAAGLAKTTSGSSAAVQVQSISYSSAYSSGNYRVTEEFVDNYNEIGNEVGTHQLMYQMKQRIENMTVNNQSVFSVAINTILGTVIGPFGSIAASTAVVPVLKECYYELSERERIADVNIFKADDALEDLNRLSQLSNVSEMHRIINVHDYGASYDNFHCRASAYAFRGKGDSDPWNKVLIVSDGFDPRLRIGIQELMEEVDHSLAPAGGSFIRTLIDNGYDLVIVDPGPVGTDIVDKARSLLRVIEYVCDKSTGNVGVGGYSMGGLLARVALLLGEKNDLSCMSKISRYLSIDSPHLGAQINDDMQEALFEISDNGLISSDNVPDPAAIIAYEKVVATVYDLKSIPARQLLFNHARGSMHDEFYGFIESLGNYPSGMKLNAIGDAAWKRPYPDVPLKTGIKAATMNGNDLILKEDDLLPGAYIDLWATSNEWNPGVGVPVPIGWGFSITFPVGSYLYDEWVGLYPDTVSTTSEFEDNDHYKPTFIPLYSAFGISREDFLDIEEPQNQSDLDDICRTYTPFDKIQLVNFTTRPKHIEFNSDMSERVLLVAKDVMDMTPIMQLLLD